jgi:hypothetical protein
VQPNTEEAFFHKILLSECGNLRIFSCFFVFVCEVVFFFVFPIIKCTFLTTRCLQKRESVHALHYSFFSRHALWVEILLHLFQLYTPTRSNIYSSHEFSSEIESYLTSIMNFTATLVKDRSQNGRSYSESILLSQ